MAHRSPRLPLGSRTTGRRSTDTERAPQTLAAVQNTVLTLVRRLGFRSTPEALEHFAEYRALAAHLLRYGRTGRPRAHPCLLDAPRGMG
jgi:hypothetical protein